MDDLGKLRQNAIVGHEQIYKCEICDKEFKNNASLKRHTNIVHQLVEEHRCNLCQKVFKIKSKLTSHVKAAHENKKLHKYDSRFGRHFPKQDT